MLKIMRKEVKTDGRKGYQTHVIGVKPCFVFDNSITQGAQKYSKHHQAKCEPKAPNGTFQMRYMNFLGINEILFLKNAQQVDDKKHAAKLAHTSVKAIT
jgi:hypothetical protein